MATSAFAWAAPGRPVRGLGALDESETRPEVICPHLLEDLMGVIASTSFPLSDHPSEPESSNTPCKNFGELADELKSGKPIEHDIMGKLDGHPAIVRRGAPDGSGQYYELDFALDLGGKTVGFCMNATALYERNLLAAGLPPPPEWNPFPGGDQAKDGHFGFRAALQGSPGGTNATFLMVPLRYHLRGRTLVTDMNETRKAIGEIGQFYVSLAHQPGDQFAKLHELGAQAFQAFAQRKECPSPEHKDKKDGNKTLPTQQEQSNL
jgi:hypothetical protein